MKKIIYVYGYSEEDLIINTVKELTKKLGYELIPIGFDEEFPDDAINHIEDYIEDHNIEYLIGHSIGGFIALCVIGDVKKLVINPTLKPQFDVPNICKITDDAIYEYEYLETWFNDKQYLLNVIGIFSKDDEQFDYYNKSKNKFDCANKIKGDHNPTIESFTEDIINKIKEFFE